MECRKFMSSRCPLGPSLSRGHWRQQVNSSNGNPAHSPRLAHHDNPKADAAIGRWTRSTQSSILTSLLPSHVNQTKTAPNNTIDQWEHHVRPSPPIGIPPRFPGPRRTSDGFSHDATTIRPTRLALYAVYTTASPTSLGFVSSRRPSGIPGLAGHWRSPILAGVLGAEAAAWCRSVRHLVGRGCEREKGEGILPRLLRLGVRCLVVAELGVDVVSVSRQRCVAMALGRESDRCFRRSGQRRQERMAHSETWRFALAKIHVTQVPDTQEWLLHLPGTRPYPDSRLECTRRV